MRRSLVAVASAVLVFAMLGSNAPTASAADCTPAEQCCRICSGGQACGKSCIAADKQCHKGRGCACNASEVCAGR